MPAGKAIALVAMPSAVLMGMGFTASLARADDQPASKSLTADEYKACVDAMTDDASASASPSASASESTASSKDSTSESTSDESSASGTSDSSSSSSSSSSDSDSDSDATAEPSASPSSSASAQEQSSSSSTDDTATASPSATETDKNILETVGDALKDLFDGDSGTESAASASASSSSSASPSASATSDSAGTSESDKKDSVADTAKDAADDATQDTTEAAKDTADTAASSASSSASPSPSASATTDVDDCPAATDDEGGVDNKIALPDDPWYLNASSLTLKGADYQGIVKVKTASGKIKKVLKYVISDGTDIGDLHQTVIDKDAGKTYHVQAGSGTTSTIKDGVTVMYTESISGNLFGLIPVTFSPDSPPPLNIPLIYFTNVKVQQAGQFGGTLTIPGMTQYTS